MLQSRAALEGMIDVLAAAVGESSRPFRLSDQICSAKWPGSAKSGLRTTHFLCIPMLVNTTLVEIVDSLEMLDEDHCIFARKPWSTNTLATVGPLTDDFRVPAEVAGEEFEYFLEVYVAIEVLEVFGTRQPNLQERRNLIFYYAENDAYPDWVYS